MDAFMRWDTVEMWKKFHNFIFKLILWNDIGSISCETALRWVPQNPIGDKAALVQVIPTLLPKPILTKVYSATWFQ